MHDAITAERLGVPGVGLMTSAFVDGAEFMARACGWPDFAFAVIDHPVSSATDEQLAERAEATLAQAEILLFESGKAG